MEETDGEITVTLRAKNMPELRKKLMAILGETESVDTSEEDFPDDVKGIYPDYRRHTHSAAMLTILHGKHKGEEKAVDSLTLANEMIDRFPRLFKGKTAGKVSFGNIFSGTFLEKKGLIKIGHKKYDNSEDEYRVYWVE